MRGLTIPCPMVVYSDTVSWELTKFPLIHSHCHPISPLLNCLSSFSLYSLLNSTADLRGHEIIFLVILTVLVAQRRHISRHVFGGARELWGVSQRELVGRKSGVYVSKHWKTCPETGRIRMTPSLSQPAYPLPGSPATHPQPWKEIT